ncbi:MAG TPA: DNA topoisomerase subunit B [Acidimicrobiales bacterium]|nr:DNA topoisomerase subunit B [Acidimicrobiales bacterium]
MALEARIVDDGRQSKPSSYTAKDMAVLEGLEPVRKRPGMYVGSTGLSGLHHLVWEVVDNSVDEAMAGYCTRIDVTLLADGGCRVVDNGRGIPTDINQQHKLSGVEIALTKLHGGAKFGGNGYKVSGGLHGVGVSVVNALSAHLIVEIDRDGKRYRMEFADGGKPQTKLEVKGSSPRGRTGTAVTFWPDGRIFEDTQFRGQTILERLQMYAFLNAGLEIRFNDEREGHDHDTVVYKYSGGIIDFVRHINASKEALFKKVAYYNTSEQDGEVEIALQWNTGYYEGIFSFANGIATNEGGMHEEGFKKALTNAVNKYARAKGHLKEKDDNLLGEDIREGLTAIVAVKLIDPQFEGQTKAKLGNVPIRSLVERATNEKLAEWLEEHPAEGRQICQKSIGAARARVAAREARNATRRKSALEGAGMPDKLRDCARGTDPRDAELFIVEGDSAGGSATQARDPQTQAILPIRGKILNVERARVDKMLKNAEIQALITAIGASLGEEFDVTKARYHKVCIMADADVDGSHIRTLLLTFFFRQMKPLVEAGYVYICQPPLYSTEVGKEKVYLKDDIAKARFVEEHPNHKNEFNRLKGLGEMDFGELGETTMHPDKRTLLQVSVEQAAIADEVLSILMGDDVEVRKHFIQTNAKDVRFLDI